MKPCGICGFLAAVVIDSGDYYTVNCENCGNTIGLFVKKGVDRNETQK